MKKYEKPYIKEEELKLEDAITVSLGDGSEPDNDPFFPDFNLKI